MGLTDKHLAYGDDIPKTQEEKDYYWALKDLKETQKEPCDDAISRQAVNTLVDELARAISDERLYMSRGRSTATIMQDILDLPPVTPKSKSESEHDHEVVKAYNDGQVYILDKIRADIERLTITEGGDDYTRKMAELFALKVKVLQIIDKYRGE